MEEMTDKYEKLVVKNQQLEEEADICMDTASPFSCLLTSYYNYSG
jgi:hypothetical protein